MINSVKHARIVIIRVAILAQFLLLPFLINAQNCDCPGIEACSPCSGGLISLSLQYNGIIPGAITVLDQMGSVYSGVVAPGGIFTFSGSLANGKFTGTQVQVRINSLPNASINTTCTGTPTLIGNVYGNFKVVAGASLNGGSICCNVSIIETTPPVFSNKPADIQTTADPGQCSKVISWQAPIVNDNCEVSSITSNYASGDSFPLGSTTVTYTAVDKFGNEASFSFLVSVLDSGTPPIVLDCPEDIQQISGDEQAIVDWVEPTAQACTNVTVVRSHQPGSSFPVGTSVVTYTFKDLAGRETGCSFNVTITKGEVPLAVNGAVTPDGDGVNDSWIISNIESFVANSVVITDRWGNTIYTASGYDNVTTVWSGRNLKGDLVPTGTYFYSIRLEGSDKNITHKKGFIEVIR